MVSRIKIDLDLLSLKVFSLKLRTVVQFAKKLQV